MIHRFHFRLPKSLPENRDIFDIFFKPGKEGNLPPHPRCPQQMMNNYGKMAEVHSDLLYCFAYATLL